MTLLTARRAFEKRDAAPTPVAEIAEALLGRHNVAKFIALRQRALDGGCVEVVLAPPGVHVGQLPLVAKPLRLVDVIGAACPLQGGLQVPPVLQQLQCRTNPCKTAAPSSHAIDHHRGQASEPPLQRLQHCSNVGLLPRGATYTVLHRM